MKKVITDLHGTLKETSKAPEAIKQLMDDLEIKPKRDRITGALIYEVQCDYKYVIISDNKVFINLR